MGIIILIFLAFYGVTWLVSGGCALILALTLPKTGVGKVFGVLIAIGLIYVDYIFIETLARENPTFGFQLLLMCFSLLAMAFRQILLGMASLVLLLLTGMLFYGFYSSDAYQAELQREWNEKAKKESILILANQDQIQVNGLYIQSTPITKSGLKRMLIERQLSFIEGNVRDSSWWTPIISRNIKEKKKDNLYFRLFFGPADSPDCVSWEGFTNKVPVRPGTCLRLTFDKRLLSDTKLENRKNEREKMGWLMEVSRIHDNKPIASIPFREFKFGLRNHMEHELDKECVNKTCAYIKLIDKLVQDTKTLNLNTEGKLYFVPNRLGLQGDYEKGVIHLTPSVKVRPAQTDLVKEKYLHWEKGYQWARTSNRPTVIDERTTYLVYLPKTDEIYAYLDYGPEALIATDRYFFGLHSRADKTEIRVRSYAKTNSWIIIPKPVSHPDEAVSCIASRNCNFKPEGLKVTDSDMIVVGRYVGRGNSDYRSEKYEWIVPMSELHGFE
jgi:hypothetical protein